MSRKKPSTEKLSPVSTRKRTSARNTTPSNVDHLKLQELRSDGKQKWMLASNTSQTYKGHVKRGRRFLTQLIESKRASRVEIEEGLEAAFDEIPNRHSAYVLELFITEKCFNQGLAYQNAEGISSAFMKMWDQAGNDGMYRGTYQIDRETGKITGNPAKAATVSDLLHAVKNKGKSAGGLRSHAEAMSIHDIQTIMSYSERQCSSQWTSYDMQVLETRRHVAEHLMMRAFLSIGFTAWTRNNELCSLRKRCYKQNAQTRPPYHIPHDLLILENRKGWTNKKGSVEGNSYRIYSQHSAPDAREHMGRWLDFYQTILLGRPLQDNEFIFPTIASNGLTYSNKGLDHDVVQKLLNVFAVGAGLQKQFTTHCLRRGGAQYRFQFCPIGERWTLSRIRWWGGWAEGEKIDTLIRYLLDELTTYEKSHDNALCPIPDEMDQSFNGDHILTQSPSANELRECMNRMDRQYEDIRQQNEELKRQNQNLQNQLTTTIALLTSNVIPASNHPHTSTSLQRSSSTTLPEPQSHSQQTTTVAALATPAITHPTSSPLVWATYPSNQSNGHGTISPPVPQATIPNLPRGGRGWKEAVNQWELVDPQTGYALKDWPKSWYTGDMKHFTAAKRTIRKRIADEYNRLSRSDTEFRKLYPDADRGVNLLVIAIRKHLGLSRKECEDE